MAFKDWFSSWGVIASFAAIAGATLLRGKTRSKVEYSHRRRQLGNDLLRDASRTLDDYGTEAIDALRSYEIADWDAEFWDARKSASGMSSEQIASRSAMLERRRQEALKDFLDADRAAALAYRYAEFADFEKQMSETPQLVEYPIGYEYPQAYEESFGGVLRRAGKPGGEDVKLGIEIRGPWHRDAAVYASKVRTADRMPMPTEYVEYQGELYDPDALGAAFAVVRDLYGRELAGKSPSDAAYVRLAREILLDSSGNKRTAEQIWKSYELDPESEEDEFERDLANEEDRVELLSDADTAALRGGAMLSTARERSDRYRTRKGPVRRWFASTKPRKGVLSSEEMDDKALEARKKQRLGRMEQVEVSKPVVRRRPKASAAPVASPEEPLVREVTIVATAKPKAASTWTPEPAAALPRAPRQIVKEPEPEPEAVGSDLFIDLHPLDQHRSDYFDAKTPGERNKIANLYASELRRMMKSPNPVVQRDLREHFGFDPENPSFLPRATP